VRGSLGRLPGLLVGLWMTTAGAPGAPAVDPPTFASIRHPSVTRTEGSYRIQITQVAGIPLSEGVLHYTLARGGQARDFTLPLTLVRQGRWAGAIPAQPVGTEIRYHFAFRPPESPTPSVRHPRRAPAARYRFRVLPFRLLRLDLPLHPLANPSQTVPVGALVEAARPPQGSVRYRLGRGAFEGAAPIRVEPLDDHRFELLAALPSGRDGTVVDYYFDLESDSEDTRWPADAPARFYSYKTTAARLATLTGGQHVAALAVTEDRTWVGLEGGGLWAIPESSNAGRLTLAEGLPASRVDSLLADPVAGVVYAATAGGAVILRAEGSPGPLFNPLFTPPGDRQKAVLLALSPLDGTLLLRLDGEEAEPERAPPVRLATLADGRLARLPLAVEGRPISAVTAAFFDPVDGCWLLGASSAPLPGAGPPRLLRRCGDAVEAEPIPGVLIAGRTFAARSIEAMAREPVTGRLALAVTYTREEGGRPVLRHGLFIQDPGGSLRGAPGLTDRRHPIGVLLADPRTSHLLVATAGEGLWRVDLAASSSSAVTGLPCPTVTALTLNPDGGVLVGTPCGLYTVRGEAARAHPATPPDTGALQPDLVPVDAHRGHFLLRSPVHGLVVAGRSSDGQIQVERNLVAGRDLPAGPYGAAAFGPRGEILVAVAGGGLLWRGADGISRRFREADGLLAMEIWKLLRAPAGESLWLAYRPSPSESPGSWPQGALQLLNAGPGQPALAPPRPLADRLVGPLADLLVLPSGDAFFAAGGGGIFQLVDGGPVERRSNRPALALARNPDTGDILGVGPGVQRWDGARWQPVTSIASHPRFAVGGFALRPALTATPDDQGGWFVLHAGGQLTRRDGAGRILRVFDAEDGIPTTANTLRFDAPTATLAIGSVDQGVVLLSW